VSESKARKTGERVLLESLARQAAHDTAVERSLGMSDDEVAGALQDEGVDLAKLDEQLAAMRDGVLAGAQAAERKEKAEETQEADAEEKAEEAVAAPIPLYRQRRFRYIAMGVGAAALVGAGAALALRGDIPILRPENTWPQPREKTPEQKRAAVLREEARASCELKDAVKCREKLEEARGMDPGGERGAGVVETRRMLDALPAVDDDDKRKRAPP
jgi:hypothetical protein